LKTLNNHPYIEFVDGYAATVHYDPVDRVYVLSNAGYEQTGIGVICQHEDIEQAREKFKKMMIIGCFVKDMENNIK
jgi:Zn-dependent membrane protease YugP